MAEEHVRPMRTRCEPDAFTRIPWIPPDSCTDDRKLVYPRVHRSRSFRPNLCQCIVIDRCRSIFFVDRTVKYLLSCNDLDSACQHKTLHTELNRRFTDVVKPNHVWLEEDIHEVRVVWVGAQVNNGVDTIDCAANGVLVIQIPLNEVCKTG